jgi:peptidoglycan hydrolase-like protein with peptidoglycan-binding domain
MRSLLAGLCLALVAPMASADTALILANTRYGDAQNLREADALLRLERPLAEAGFEVIVVANGSTDAMRGGIERLLEAEEDTRLLILAAGHMVRSGAGSWLLGVDASEPNLARVGAQGIDLSLLMELAGRVPGRSIVMLGQEARRVDLGPGLVRGLGPLDPPQGVSVITGAPEALADFARDVVLEPGADLPGALSQARGLRGLGFLSSAVPFLAPEPEPVAVQGGPGSDEIALWEAALELNTAGAFRAYLQQYPRGAFAEEARARIEALTLDPLEQAEAAEEALGLSRDARRSIQRDLSLLGYDTRGIDGIFGPGTRRAIQGWQQDNREEGTGFITRTQINELRDQAAIRAAELEEQARIEREAQERADRAFWQATGQGADEAGLRSYLQRFPDGLFAEIAEARLAEIEAARRAEAEAQERADWDRVRAADTINAYEQYLAAYPNGLFRQEAGARIDALRNPGVSLEDLAAAEAQEAALNMPQLSRMLAEQRLAAMGLEPGRVDGTFDEATRRAIRRYQGARGLPATGYLTQDTVVRLLAEAIGGRILE